MSQRGSQPGATTPPSSKKRRSLIRLPSKLLSRPRGSDWLNQIEKIAYGCPVLDVNGNINLQFPLTQLRECTDSFLKGRWTSTQQQVNSDVVTLVKKYQARDVALLACAHILTTEVIRMLLYDEIRSENEGSWDAVGFLRAIIAANHSNPDAISQEEATFARLLVRLVTPNPMRAGSRLQAMFSSLSPSTPMELLLRPLLVIVPQACAAFHQHLHTLRSSAEWKKAYTSSSWLKSMVGMSQLADSLFDRHLPFWRSWAAWQPNLKRLELWSGSLESNSDRDRLYDILDLEGPDFESSHSTLGDGLVAYTIGPHNTILHRHLSLEVEGSNRKATLDRFLTLLDSALAREPISLSLFVALCLSPNRISPQHMQLLDDIYAADQPDIESYLLDLLTLQGRSSASKQACLVRLIPSLKRAEVLALREKLAPRIAPIVEEVASTLRNKFCHQMRDGRDARGTARALAELGEVCADAPWLQPLVASEILPAPRQNFGEDMDMLWEIKSHSSGICHDGKGVSDMIDAFLRSQLARESYDGIRFDELIDALLKFWKQWPETELRETAILVASIESSDILLLQKCLTSLSSLAGQKPKAVHELGRAVGENSDSACLNFSNILLSKHFDSPALRDLLLHNVRQRGASLVDHCAARLDLETWFQWLNELGILFRDGDLDYHDPPPILHPSLHKWARRLHSNYHSVLTVIYEAGGNAHGLPLILKSWWQTCRIEPLLHVLQRFEANGHLKSVLPIMRSLSQDWTNAVEVFATLTALGCTSPRGTQAWTRILDLFSQTQEEIAAVMWAAWLRHPETVTKDKHALEKMGSLLGISATLGDLRTSVQVAISHFDSEHESLLAQAEGLNSIQEALRTHDSQATSQLLLRLGLRSGRSQSRFADSDIPDPLVDFVEKVDDNEFELFFPLNNLRPFHRLTLDVDTSTGMVVRLKSSPSGAWDSFCIHLDPEPWNMPSIISGHQYISVSSTIAAPDTATCTIGHSRTLYQLNRQLWMELKNKTLSIEQLYDQVNSWIQILSDHCIVCGQNLGARLWRSTTCSRQCSISFQRSHLSIRVVDIRDSSAVIDILLSSVFSASASGLKIPKMLQGCPLNDAASLQKVLRSIPAMETLKGRPDMVAVIKSLGRQAEALLSWICMSHRSFITSATGDLKIPSLPGVVQFVVASSSPDIEARFNVHGPNTGNTKVVFHGTGIDRLYSIIREGLKICSHTSLQRNGAVNGSGIYVTDSTQTSLGYAYGAPTNQRWPASKYPGVRVVLGCELVGHTAWRGVHVVTDVSTLIVRYIFLVGPMATMPEARHIAPAMMSAYNSLRSGLAYNRLGSVM